MNKKRIFISALVGTIALAALSVSLTLAWYGASDRVGISGLDIDVYSTANLKISTTTKPEDFKDELKKDQLMGEGEKDIVFTPVSSMLKDSWFNKEGKKDTPLFYDSSFSMITSDGEPIYQPVAQGNGFFQKELYLMTNLTDYYAGLDIDACVFEADEEENFKRARDIYHEIHDKDPQSTLTINQIGDMIDGIQKSLRVSILVTNENFYKYYIIDPNKEARDVTYFGGLLDNNRDGFYDTYETKVNDVKVEKEVVYGEVNDRSLIQYKDPVSTIENSTQEAPEQEEVYWDNSFEGISKDTAYTFDKDLSEREGLKFAQEESLSLDDIRQNDHSILIPCYQNTPSKIVLSVYLEGWDLDCINATMGTSFNIALSFKLIGGIV